MRPGTNDMGECKHVRIYREKYLAKGETVEASSEGYIGKVGGEGKEAQHWGALLVTKTVVIFYRKGFFGEINQSIPLDKITSIEQSRVLNFQGIRLHTSHDDLKFTTVNANEYKQIVAAIESGRMTKPATSASAGDSPLDALKKLGDLRTAGVISDAEFDEKKRHLLSRI